MVARIASKPPRPGQLGPQAIIESVALIGFQIDRREQKRLEADGVVFISPTAIYSRADIDQTLQLIVISLRLPEAEVMRVESMVDKRGKVVKSLSEEGLIYTLARRFRQRKHRSN